jgi:tetratricopeptide (TPR) repeat protein
MNRAMGRAKASGNIPMQALLEANLSMNAYLGNQGEMAWERAQRAVSLWKTNSKRFSPQQAVDTLRLAAQTMSYERMADPLPRAYLEEAVRLSVKHREQVFATTRAQCLAALANSYHALDFRYQEAYPLIQEAIAINRADPLRGRELGQSLLTLGIVTRYLGRAEESERALGEGYRIFVRMFGAESFETATLEAHWAVSLAETGRPQEGYRAATKALLSKRHWYPEPGSYLLWTNLAAASYTACLTKRFVECESLAREGLKSLGTKPNAEDYRLHDAHAFLGIALAGQGRNEEAREWIDDSIAFNARRGRTVPFAKMLSALAGH